MKSFEDARQFVCERFRFVVGYCRVEWDIDLKSLGTGSLRKALESEFGEHVADPDSDLAALHDVGGSARIEIEDYVGRPQHIGGFRERCMEFDIREIRRPNERRKVLCETVIHPLIVAGTPDLRGVDPVGTVRRTVLLIEVHSIDAVRIALQGERSSAKMGQQYGRDAHVIVDHLALGESSVGPEDFAKVGDPDLFTGDVYDLFFACHEILRCYTAEWRNSRFTCLPATPYEE